MRGTLIGLALASSLGVHSTAVAQLDNVEEREVADTASEEDEAETAKRERSEVPEDELIVYGIRTGILPPDPSSFRTTIDTDDYAGEQLSLEDLLSAAVGVQIRRFGGPGERAEISVRGSTANQVVVLVDGVQMNSSQSGSLDLSSIPVAFIERIEISRGGGSVDQGSGAIGGVVNLITRRESATPTTKIIFSYGSFDTFEGSVFHSRKLGQFDASLGYQGFATDGDFEFKGTVDRFPDGTAIHGQDSERINNEQEKHNLSATLGHKLGDFGYLRARESLHYASTGQPGLATGPGVYAGQQEFAHQRDFRSVSHLAWDGPGLLPSGAIETQSSASLHYRYERSKYRNPEVTFDPAIESLQKLGTLGGEVAQQWNPTWTLREQKMLHSLQLRVGAKSETLDADDRDDVDRESVSVVLADELSAFGDRLRIAPALRFDKAEGFESRWLPRIGVVVSPTEWLRVQANVEKSFRIPTFDELYLPNKGYTQGNPDLEPERAHNYDVGFMTSFDQLGPVSQIEFEASYFHNDIRDSIVWMLVSPTVVAPRNTGNATSEGTELALAFSVTRWVRVAANHTYTDATRDASGSRLIGRPEHEVDARVTIGDPLVWKIFTRFHYTGETTANEADSVILQARETWDAGAALNLAELSWLPIPTAPEALWLSFEGANLGDRSLRDGLYSPQPGLTVRGALEVTW